MIVDVRGQTEYILHELSLYRFVGGRYCGSRCCCWGCLRVKKLTLESAVYSHMPQTLSGLDRVLQEGIRVTTFEEVANWRTLFDANWLRGESWACAKQRIQAAIAVD